MYPRRAGVQPDWWLWWWLRWKWLWLVSQVFNYLWSPSRFFFLGSCSNSFQCYDGSCIPSTSVCDGFVGCAGLYPRDEETCESATYTSCLEYRQSGFKQNGLYTIYPRGLSSKTSCIHDDDMIASRSLSVQLQRKSDVTSQALLPKL